MVGMLSCQLPFSRGFPYASLPPLCLLADLYNSVSVCHVGRGTGRSSPCRSGSRRASGHDSCRSGKSGSPFSRHPLGTGHTNNSLSSPTTDDNSSPSRTHNTGHASGSRRTGNSPLSPDDHSRTAQPDGSRGAARWSPPGRSRRQSRCKTGDGSPNGFIHPASGSHEG